MNYKLLQGDCISVVKTLPSGSVNCVVTSPPYWGLRDYKVDGQFGLEPTPDLYVQHLVELFREIKRVLKDDGTCWLNLGDSFSGSGCGTNDYRTEASKSINKSDKMFSKLPPQQKFTGLKPKDLVGIPWRVAFALQADGWWLRSDIIWAKRNCMPESVKDRPTRSHEYIFLLTKSASYYYDAEAIKEPYAQATIERVEYPSLSTKYHDHKESAGSGSTFIKLAESGKAIKEISPLGNGRNKRDVWWVSTKPFKDAHFATFPEDLIKPCVLAGCPTGGTILDPFNGAGTTGVVALKNDRNYIGIELNSEYIEMSRKRIDKANQQERLI